MPISLLKINWDSGTEFISIDLDDKSIVGQYINTTEYWVEEKELVKYTVLCTDFYKQGDEVHITLKYSKNKNIALKGINESWGVSEIIANVHSRKVKARWSDIRKGDDYSGLSGKCALLDDDLLNEMSYETISRLARPQQSAIRKNLIQAYGQCALTGEKTTAVLDAAHIIEAGKKGAYTLKNCLLLRSDLHRLFDRGYLKFSHLGDVTVSPEIRGRYLEELAGKRLPADVMKNVADALRVRYGLHSDN